LAIDEPTVEKRLEALWPKKAMATRHTTAMSATHRVWRAILVVNLTDLSEISDQERAPNRGRD